LEKEKDIRLPEPLCVIRPLVRQLFTQRMFVTFQKDFPKADEKYF
jgi:hypothetical protein